jgi:hypothetical protein
MQRNAGLSLIDASPVRARLAIFSSIPLSRSKPCGDGWWQGDAHSPLGRWKGSKGETTIAAKNMEH